MIGPETAFIGDVELIHVLKSTKNLLYPAILTALESQFEPLNSRILFCNFIEHFHLSRSKNQA
jgi:hypothetical protein